MAVGAESISALLGGSWPSIVSTVVDSRGCCNESFSNCATVSGAIKAEDVVPEGPSKITAGASLLLSWVAGAVESEDVDMIKKKKWYLGSVRWVTLTRQCELLIHSI